MREKMWVIHFVGVVKPFIWVWESTFFFLSLVGFEEGIKVRGSAEKNQNVEQFNVTKLE